MNKMSSRRKHTSSSKSKSHDCEEGGSEQRINTSSSSSNNNTPSGSLHQRRQHPSSPESSHNDVEYDEKQGERNKKRLPKITMLHMLRSLRSALNNNIGSSSSSGSSTSMKSKKGQLQHVRRRLFHQGSQIKVSTMLCVCTALLVMYSVFRQGGAAGGGREVTLKVFTGARSTTLILPRSTPWDRARLWNRLFLRTLLPPRPCTVHLHTPTASPAVKHHHHESNEEESKYSPDYGDVDTYQSLSSKFYRKLKQQQQRQSAKDLSAEEAFLQGRMLLYPYHEGDHYYELEQDYESQSRRHHHHPHNHKNNYNKDNPSTSDLLSRYAILQEQRPSYYNQDDDALYGSSLPVKANCRRTMQGKMGGTGERAAWNYPVCNVVHEGMGGGGDDFVRYGDGGGDGGEGLKYLGRGSFREVYGTIPLNHTTTNYPYVIKKQRLNKRGKNQKHWIANHFEGIRTDAMVMDLLHSSPAIVDIYAYCGGTVVTERLYEEAEAVILPGAWYVSQAELNDSQDVDVRNVDTLPDVSQKLKIALQMAEGIAALHGARGGPIVHDDHRLCQYLRRDGKSRFKLNDFNRAQVLTYHVGKGEYCPYENNGAWGNHRSPEEYTGKLLNEQIDVYSMGNNIYSLLTGLDVYYENEDDTVAQKFVISGELPYIDPRYRTRSYAEGALVKILERCWVYDTRERATIFEVVEFLTRAVEEDERLKKENTKGGRR